jgi:hypothetical protein
LICMAMASSATLNVSYVRGLVRLSGTEGTQRPRSLNSASTTAGLVNSMLSYSQSSASYVLASKVITLRGLGILSMR